VILVKQANRQSKAEAEISASTTSGTIEGLTDTLVAHLERAEATLVDIGRTAGTIPPYEAVPLWEGDARAEERLSQSRAILRRLEARLRAAQATVARRTEAVLKRAALRGWPRARRRAGPPRNGCSGQRVRCRR